MTASERAQQLVWDARKTTADFVRGADPRYGPMPGDEDAMKQAASALLTYVARLEAVAETARTTIVNHYGPFGEIKKALAALDRPEE